MSPWPIGGSHRKARIFKASRGFEILLTKPSNEPYSSADFSQNVPRLFKASSNASLAEERGLHDLGPDRITALKSARIYTEVRTAGPLVMDRGPKDLIPLPPHESVLRECCVLAERISIRTRSM